MQNLLFISWDGPQVHYLEGLFLPIFVGLKNDYNIYVVQFSWADKAKVVKTKAICEEAGIYYSYFPISRKPHPLPGSIFTLLKGTGYLRHYIERNKINIVMPRSTFPALMAKHALSKIPGVRFVFDADGLPIDERVDFAGLNPKGLQYKYLKSIELDAIERAAIVLTRTERAKTILSRGDAALSAKFRIVSNGRDENFFKSGGKLLRSELGISSEALVMVYAGSLGPQYCVQEMLKLYKYVRGSVQETYFLILTGSPEYLEKDIYSSLLDAHVIVRSVSPADVPQYLSVADVGLAIRQPSYSMQGVAPIKIGEYLLTGLPVVASAGIGDTESILAGETSCFILPNHGDKSIMEAAAWIKKSWGDEEIRKSARHLGERVFGLQKSVASYKAALSSLF